MLAEEERIDYNAAKVGRTFTVFVFFNVFVTRECQQRHYAFGIRAVSLLHLFVRPDRSCYHDIS